MAILVILLLGGLSVYAVARSLPPSFRRAAALMYGAHLISAAVQVWMHADYYGSGDMFGYFFAGKDLALLLRLDFFRWLPEVVGLILHRETNFFSYVSGQGGSSGTMVGLGGLLVFVCDDVRPLWPACLLMGTTSAIAQIIICKVALDVFEAKWHRPAAFGVLFIPSVIFWSSALTKEAVALPFLALLLSSFVAVSKGSWRAVFGVLVGAGGLGLVKGYILMPFILSAAIASFVARNAKAGERAGGKGRWAYAVAGMLGALVALAAMSLIFPEYAPGSIVENTARYQQTYGALEAAGEGGSNLDIGSIAVGQGERATLLGQLQFVPMAVVNALFRPLVFEARSVVQLLASIETTLIVGLTVRLVVSRAGRRAFGEVMQSPPLAFCSVFVMTFSVAVGLSTLNLGTLSRYRIPMMPFFAVLLFVLGQQQRAVKSPVAPVARRPVQRLRPLSLPPRT